MAEQHTDSIKKEQTNEPYQVLEKLNDTKLDEYLEEVSNNMTIFIVWAKNSLDENNFAAAFHNIFAQEYRSQLFEQVCHFFHVASIVTDEVLFYWKYLVVSLLCNSKKYKTCLNDLVFDLENRHTNLRLVKQKSIFRCFIDEEPVCYFKENSNEYYVS